tara:strand:+ start:1291 stop:1563 length:273 start_codon:yes stop_codon:yes gene_type:complete
MKFDMGTLVVTSGVDGKMQDSDEFAEKVRGAIIRHSTGDWGDLCDEDREENERSLREGDRLMSVYNTQPVVWVITEWDRSVTTVLFPEEY